MASTIAASVVARIYDVAVGQGVSEATLCATIGRSRTELVEDARVTIDATFACFAACMQHTQDASFPLQVAQAVAVEDYPVLGFAMMTSATVTEAFDRLVRYGHLISDSGTWRMRESRREVELCWLRAGRRSLGHRVANECALAELLGGLRSNYGKNLRPVKVYFRHPAPADARAHQRYFGAPIVWGATKDALVFTTQLLSLPASKSNVAMSRYFDGLLKRHVQAHASCAGRVQQVLTVGLSSGRPSATAVALQLGMSERSLRRALAEEATSFRDVLDELRRTIASDMIEANKSGTEIAFLLGFSETSALSRAFRRWHGTSMRRRLK